MFFAVYVFWIFGGLKNKISHVMRGDAMSQAIISIIFIICNDNDNFSLRTIWRCDISSVAM